MDQVPVTLLGHRDHGKSTLIGRLLMETNSVPTERIAYAKELSTSQGKNFEYAFLMDSFREEREQEMTIDTASAKLQYSDTIFELIDVPGHKELAKNMLSGASRAKSGLLVVSAKPGEGLQEETRLHLFLAKMLGLEKLAVAVTKMDLVGYERKIFETLKADVSAYLRFAGFDPANIRFIPVSAMDGVNVVEKSEKTPWYDGSALLPFMAEAYRAFAQTGPLRFLVQDAYDVDAQRVYVGQVKQGALASGAKLLFQPQGERATVAALASGKNEATQGKNEALVLDAPVSIGRGSVGFPADAAPALSSKLFATLFFLPQSALDSSKPVAFQSASAQTNVSLQLQTEFDLLLAMETPATTTGPLRFFRAVLSFDAPVLAEPASQTPFLGRFVLKDGGKIAA
ncbi:MAG: GTP-binding protein, partial [Candidatus Micrarchaeota archaeon]|nr:GTP-binding protein [Candidatus Micrarchaeota archaeon]